jgi:hypothetical protein
MEGKVVRNTTFVLGGGGGTDATLSALKFTMECSFVPLLTEGWKRNVKKLTLWEVGRFVVMQQREEADRLCDSRIFTLILYMSFIFLSNTTIYQSTHSHFTVHN